MDLTADPKKSLSYTDIEETFDKIRKQNEEDWRDNTGTGNNG